MLGRIARLTFERKFYIVYERSTASEPVDVEPFQALVLRSPGEVRDLAHRDVTLVDFPHLDELERRFAGGNALVLLLDEGHVVHTTWVAFAAEAAHEDPVLQRFPDPATGFIGPCYTRPTSRGKGAYPLALRTACAVLHAAGRTRALINTAVVNRPSQQGIRRAGFVARWRVCRTRVGPRSVWRTEGMPGRDRHPLVWFSPTLRQSGGGERIPLEGMEYFTAAGLEAVLVTFDFDRAAVFDGRYAPKVIARKAGTSMGGGLLTRLARVLRRVLWLRRTLRRLRPAAVITHGTWGQSVDLFLATLATPVKYAVHVYGSVFAMTWEHTRYALVFRQHFATIRDSTPSYQRTTNPRPPTMSLLARLQLEVFAVLKWISVRHAAIRFVLSRRNAWEVELLYGRPAVTLKGAFPRVALGHPRPEDPAAVFGAPPGSLIVLTVSRLVENKRVDLTLRAFALLAARDPRAFLVVGGKGEEAERLQALASDLGVAGRVRFAGYVPERVLWDWYAACDVFVSMDLADFDIAPYEALAVGARVVWADEMEMDPELAGYPAVESAAPDPEAIAAAMTRVLAVPRPGPERAAVLARYSWERYFDDMLHELVAR